MKNTRISLFNKISKPESISVLNKVIVYFDKKVNDFTISKDELDIKYRLDIIRDCLLSYKDNYFSTHDKINNGIKKSYRFQNEDYVINIHRFDNEIKLYIKNLKNGDYLITNTLNYFKNIYYYFNTCYLNNNDKEVIDIKINTNNLEENIITFKREDGIVYDFIDSFNTDYEVKEGLTSLIRLKNLINLNNDKPKEVISPEEYSELLFGVNNIEELEFLKEIRLNGLLHNSLKLDQYKEECGIDTYSSYWKVNSKNPIGNMLLQSLYINKINKRIHELKKEKK